MHTRFGLPLMDSCACQNPPTNGVLHYERARFKQPIACCSKDRMVVLVNSIMANVVLLRFCMHVKVAWCYFVYMLLGGPKAGGDKLTSTFSWRSFQWGFCSVGLNLGSPAFVSVTGLCFECRFVITSHSKKGSPKAIQLVSCLSSEELPLLIRRKRQVMNTAGQT